MIHAQAPGAIHRNLAPFVQERLIAGHPILAQESPRSLTLYVTGANSSYLQESVTRGTRFRRAVFEQLAHHGAQFSCPFGDPNALVHTRRLTCRLRFEPPSEGYGTAGPPLE
jgi:hypothetical protein